MRTVLICFVMLLHLCAGQAAAQYYTTVPLRHQVYPLLFKAEALGIFHSYELRQLPLTRAAVLKLLQATVENDEKLSTADRSLLQQMLKEFTDPAIGASAPPGSEIHLFRYEEGDAQIFVDARLQQTFLFNRNQVDLPDDNISETLAAGAMRARFGDHIFVGLEARNKMIIGEDDPEENFDPTTGRILSTVGSTAFSDQATGYVSARFGKFTVLLGRNTLSWGAGLDDRLALSAANEPVDMLQLYFDFKPFRFSSAHASLQGIAQQRYLAGHRLDFMFWPALQFGVYETLIYGGRNLELAYLNPFVPYHIIEHQLGDLDNNVLGFDLTAFPAPGIRLFGEIFIDDFSFNRSITGYWGNKFAYQAGLQWAQPFGFAIAELTASYTRVDPWVYTHDDSVNIYAHYDQSLGSRLGPNADRVQTALALQPLRDTRLVLDYRFSRHGEGNVFVAHTPEDGEEKNFLAGVIEKRHELTFVLRHQVRRDLFLGFEVQVRHRRDANLEPGQDRTERFASFFLDINY